MTDEKENSKSGVFGTICVVLAAILTFIAFMMGTLCLFVGQYVAGGITLVSTVIFIVAFGMIKTTRVPVKKPKKPKLLEESLGDSQLSFSALTRTKANKYSTVYDVTCHADGLALHEGNGKQMVFKRELVRCDVPKGSSINVTLDGVDYNMVCNDVLKLQDFYTWYRHGPDGVDSLAKDLGVDIHTK